MACMALTTDKLQAVIGCAAVVEAGLCFTTSIRDEGDGEETGVDYSARSTTTDYRY